MERGRGQQYRKAEPPAQHRGAHVDIGNVDHAAAAEHPAAPGPLILGQRPLAKRPGSVVVVDHRVESDLRGPVEIVVAHQLLEAG